MIFFLLAQVTSLGATNYTVDAPIKVPLSAPTFSDEFTGKVVDEANWRFDTSRNLRGWHNNEKQYYADARLNNARIERGALVLEARRQKLSRARYADWGGQAYTSAKLVSRKRFGYGFYEVRAKLPCGRGIWPAIWMLPPSSKWPDGGEIDIMEMVGSDPNTIHATLHSGAFNHAKGTQRGAQTRVVTSCTRFHRYQLDWRPDTITIGVDDRAYMRVPNDQSSGPAAWPFNKPYELILNVAVGGDWGGQKGVDDAAFPQAMAVDYVRYWRTRL